MSSHISLESLGLGNIAQVPGNRPKVGINRAARSSVSATFWSLSFLPLPHPPLSLFGSRPIFRAGKTPKIPFLGLSLPLNPTETLATQAKLGINRAARSPVSATF